MIRGEKPTWGIYLILCECPQEASQGVRERVGQGRKCAEVRLYESWGYGGEGQQSSLVQERQGERQGKEWWVSRSQRSGRGESSAGCTGLRRVLKGSGAGELPSGRHENKRIRPKPEWAACVGASVVSDSVRPHGLQPARLLCPWNSPGKNTGVGCHALYQGTFPSPGSYPYLSCLTCIGRPVLYY